MLAKVAKRFATDDPELDSVACCLVTQAAWETDTMSLFIALDAVTFILHRLGAVHTDVDFA